MHTQARVEESPQASSLKAQASCKAWLDASHKTVIAICGAIIAVSLILPAAHVEEGVHLPIVGTRIPSTCAMQRMTETGCPACGLTRGFILSAHGQWARAQAMQPLAAPLFLLCALQIPMRLMLLRRPDWSVWFNRQERWGWLGLSVLVLGTWAVRLGHELLWPLLR